jgi:uncharacterized protein (DUF2384 family)
MARLTLQATDLLPAKSTSVWTAKVGPKKLTKEDFVSLFEKEPLEHVTKKNQHLAAKESPRVLGIRRLIGQTQTMVETSGHPDGFDAAAWVAQWLDQSLPALGGQRPAGLMDTAEGQAIVSSMLSRAQSGAYA